jgi:DNA repair protein RadA/Sms
MAKPQDRFVCQACGAVHHRWQGRCEACQAWNSIVEEVGRNSIPKGLSTGKGHVLALSELGGAQPVGGRQVTGIGEFDRVLGGGLVAGSAILIGGDPGIGKSTLVLQAMAGLASQGAVSVYVSGEEAVAQIGQRAQRLGLAAAPVKLAAATDLRDIIATLEAEASRAGHRRLVAAIDSIQTLFADNLDSAPGTVTQLRACVQELVRFAKRREASVLLVGHVTKEGELAGPRVVEHMVDTVLYFEGERGHQFRILRAVKNRFGATDEIGVFAMTDRGLAEVPNPSALFLGRRDRPVSGAAVFAGIEGTRPLLVEIQALVTGTPMASPRRAVVGWDTNRLAMVLAVLDARCGLSFTGSDVYLSVAGGLRVQEPAADLAVAAALLSSLCDRPAPDRAVFFGEIGLSGEIRPVGHAEARMKEAAKLGFAQAIVPAGSAAPAAGLKVVELAELADLRALFPEQRARRAV